MIKFVLFFIVALLFLAYVYISWRFCGDDNEGSGGGGGTDHEKPDVSEGHESHDDDNDHDDANRIE